MQRCWSMVFALLMVLGLPALALAAGGDHPTIPGPELSAIWVIPFACMLLSIAIMPLAAPHFWEHHFGKIAVFCNHFAPPASKGQRSQITNV